MIEFRFDREATVKGSLPVPNDSADPSENYWKLCDGSNMCTILLIEPSLVQS